MVIWMWVEKVLKIILKLGQCLYHRLAESMDELVFGGENFL